MLLAVSCATPPPPPPPPPPTVEVIAPGPELNTARLCRVIADVEDAEARSALGLLRLQLEAGSDGNRHAQFGAMLARPKNEERFRAFHDDETTRPESAVGPLGACLVYSDWKMSGQRDAACKLADERLKNVEGHEALLRYADAVFHARRGEGSEAMAAATAGLSARPACEALLFLRADLLSSSDDVAARLQAWTDAEAGMPGCFTCAVEVGKIIEQREGKAAAAPAWERALKVVPDHADTLRRLAAAVAGTDDARALAAYVSAVDSGARDFGTLLAAARLATQLAQKPDEIERALGLAQRAVDAGRSDPDARRLLVDLAMRKGDLDAAGKAGTALLELLPTDLVGHAALARAAAKKEDLVEAVVHYDATATEISAGRTAGLDAATIAALTKERGELLAQLKIDEKATRKGSAAAVANAVQRSLTSLWKTRVAAGSTKTGTLTLIAETDSTGRVVDVAVKADNLGEPLVTAAAVASLRRATISGGAKRYTLDFTFQ
jgi:hypothetical protein